MATPSSVLIKSLRRAAARLQSGADYQWGHFGQCNCGHLAQVVTGLSAAQIHERTFTKLTEWSEIPEAYCPLTGAQHEYAIDALLEIGLSREDVRQLENLSNPAVLVQLPTTVMPLRKNNRDHAILYFRAWASLLEKQLPAESDELEPWHEATAEFTQENLVCR